MTKRTSTGGRTETRETRETTEIAEIAETTVPGGVKVTEEHQEGDRRLRRRNPVACATVVAVVCPTGGPEEADVHRPPTPNVATEAEEAPPKEECNRPPTKTRPVLLPMLPWPIPPGIPPSPTKTTRGGRGCTKVLACLVSSPPWICPARWALIL